MQSFPVLKALSGSQKVIKIFGFGLDKRQAVILIGAVLLYYFLYKQVSGFIALSTAQGVILFSPLIIAAFVLAFGMYDGRHLDWWIVRKWTNYLRPGTLVYRKRRPGRKQAVRDSVQAALPAEEIVWDMLKTSNGEYIIAFEVQPVNLSLSGDSERERIWAASWEFYNRIDFPIVEMTRSWQGNIATYVHTLREHILNGVSSEEEHLAAFAAHHLEFLTDVVKRYNVYDSTSYILLTYRPKDAIRGSDTGMFWSMLETLGLWKKKPSPAEAKKLQQEAEGAYRVLDNRKDIVDDGMYRIGARLKPLDGTELLQLIKDQTSGEDPAAYTPAIEAVGGPKANATAGTASNAGRLHAPVVLGEARYDRLSPDKLKQVLKAAQNVRKAAPPAVGIGEMTVADKIAPEAIKDRGDYLRVGDRYHATLFVSEWPDQVHLGILQHVLNIPGRVKIVKYTKPLSKEKAVSILGSKVAELQAAEATAQDGNVISTQQRTTARFSAETAMGELINGRQSFLEVSLLIHCEADSRDALHSLVESVRTKLAGIRAEAKLAREEAYEGYISTIFGKNLLTKRYSATGMLTDPAACLFIHGSYEVNHPEGVLLGVNPVSGGLIVLDSRELMNPHMVVLGTTGGGKSQSVKAISTRLRMRGQRVVMIDPVGNTKYGDVARQVDGEYVVFGTGTPHKFNPCDLGEDYMNLSLLANDADEETRENPTAAREKARAAALDGKILMLTRLVSLMVASDDGTGGLDAGEQGMVDRLWAEVYAKKGITSDPDTHDNEPPTFKHFFAALAQAAQTNSALARLREQLYPWEAGALRTFFDSQTNVNLDNKYLVLQIAGVSGREKAAVMYALLDFLNSKLSNPNEISNCFIDEFWSLLEYPMSAHFAEELWRSGRARNNAMGAISQDIAEFQASPQGGVILNISATHLILRQRKKTIERLSDFYDFSAEQKQELMNIQGGEGYLLVEENQIPLYVICSEQEMKLYNTDPKKQLAYDEADRKELAAASSLPSPDNPQDYDQIPRPGRKRLSAVGRARQLLSDDDDFMPSEEDYEDMSEILDDHRQPVHTDAPGGYHDSSDAATREIALSHAAAGGTGNATNEPTGDGPDPNSGMNNGVENSVDNNPVAAPDEPPEGGEETPASDSEDGVEDRTPGTGDTHHNRNTTQPPVVDISNEAQTTAADKEEFSSNPEDDPVDDHDRSPGSICAVCGDTSALVAFNLSGLVAHGATRQGKKVLLVDAEGSLSNGLFSGVTRRPADELIEDSGLHNDLDAYLMHDPNTHLLVLCHPDDGSTLADDLMERLQREFDLLVVPCGTSEYATGWLQAADTVIASAATARALSRSVETTEELRQGNGTLLAPMGRLRLPDELCHRKIHKLPSIKTAALAASERSGQFATLTDQTVKEAFEPLAAELFDPSTTHTKTTKALEPERRTTA